VSGIDVGVSITVDIAFVAGDTGILMRDNSLVSKDQTDPQVTGFLNTGLADSTVSGNFTLPSDAAITVPIVTANVPVAIGGTWSSSEKERVDFTEVGGIATYTGIETRRITIGFGSSLTGAASNFFGLHILLNDVDITDAPPIFDIINASTSATAGGAQIVTLSTGDTIQVAVSNLVNTQDPEIVQSHMIWTPV